jgi:superfamily II DNA/RNA helicase
MSIIMKCFKDFALPTKLHENLTKIDFKTPTPIQIQAIPPALNGQDVLGSAQTGTGKTGAFGIPLIAKLMNDEESSALVLLPTRELALQVLQALKSFINKENIKTALLIGGEPMAKQYAQLKVKPRLVVATPGRVNDHLNRQTLKLSRTNFLVLDEVDRMLDMGFGIQLEEIAKHLTSERQTLMFTATLPPNIKKLAAKYLISPVHVSVGDSYAPADKVKQENIKLADSDKYPRLLKELEDRTGSILVFVGTKHSADRMAAKLFDEGHNAKALHGDLHQVKRTKIIAAFRQERCRILVATDIAARGLDISHIEHVINYDLPQNPEDYIHRIGRTARAGAEGHAINFISPKDSIKWRNIAKLMNPNDKDSEDPRGAPRGGSRSSSGPRAGGRNFSDRRGRESSGGERGFSSRRSSESAGGERGFSSRRSGESAGGERGFSSRRSSESAGGERGFSSRRSGESAGGERSFSNRGGRTGTRERGTSDTKRSSGNGGRARSQNSAPRSNASGPKPRRFED